MNLEQTKQIVEAIKTLNINFNDATTQKIADTIVPIFKMYIIQQYISMFLLFFGIVGTILTIAFLAAAGIKRNEELEEKRITRREELEERKYKN